MRSTSTRTRPRQPRTGKPADRRLSRLPAPRGGISPDDLRCRGKYRAAKDFRRPGRSGPGAGTDPRSGATCLVGARLNWRNIAIRLYGIVAGNCEGFDAKKARPNRREPLQLATRRTPALDARYDHQGHQLSQRLGDQALGSHLKLLQTINGRSRRACWRDDEGLAIAGFLTQPFVRVVGHRSLEPECQRRSSGFRNRHQRGQGAGR